MNKFCRPILWGVVLLGICQMSPTSSYAEDPPGPLVQSVQGPEASFSFTEEELEKQVPPAQAADVASPEAIIRAFHDLVSGPEGTWNADRMRSLCIPNVHLEYADKGAQGDVRIATITLDQLIKEIQRLHESTAWYEKVLNVHVNKVNRPDSNAILAVAIYTGVERTHPIATYRGAGSTSVTTLLYVKQRWWIVSHMW